MLVTTFGVGELSALNAQAGSFAESVPVLHIVGAPRKDLQAARRNLHYTLADGTFDRFLRMAREISVAAEDIEVATAAEQIDSVLRRVVLSASPGICFLPRMLRPRSFQRHALNFSGSNQCPQGPRKRRLRRSCAGCFRVAVRSAIEGADALITLGVTLGDTTTSGYRMDLPESGQIDLHRSHAAIDGEWFATLPLERSLEILERVLVELGTQPMPVEKIVGPEDKSAPDSDAPLTQDQAFDQLWAALDSSNVFLAGQGSSFFGADPDFSLTVRTGTLDPFPKVVECCIFGA